MEPPTEGRSYPLHTPRENYEPPVPRWMLKLPEGVKELFTVYIGVNCHKENDFSDTKTVPAVVEAVRILGRWLEGDDATSANGRNDHAGSAVGDDVPVAVEKLNVISGYDQPNSPVWVAYWTDRRSGERALARLNLVQVHHALGEQSSSVGLWTESFVTPIERLETNYSGTDYKPGLAHVPRSEQIPHKFTAYWGAARDRVPASAHDAFERSSSSGLPENAPTGIGEIISGTNYDNMVHIRTGQFWENCDQEEAAAYENQLEPSLRKGLNYLHEHPDDTGNLGLRFLRNVSESSDVRKETCAAGFFRSLGDLEKWVQRHPSHLRIYKGAHDHAKKFAGNYYLRTWHEVSVLKSGEASFEYVNCVPSTGAIKFLGMNTAVISAQA